jgi:predicted RNA-binding protein YlxR (DUF448 family)
VRLAAVGSDEARAPDLVVVDRAARLPGRGAYVCNADCAQAALQRRALPRAFRRRVSTPSDFVESIG